MHCTVWWLLHHNHRHQSSFYFLFVLHPEPYDWIHAPESSQALQFTAIKESEYHQEYKLWQKVSKIFLNCNIRRHLKRRLFIARQSLRATPILPSPPKQLRVCVYSPEQLNVNAIIFEILWFGNKCPKCPYIAVKKQETIRHLNDSHLHCKALFGWLVQHNHRHQRSFSFVFVLQSHSIGCMYQNHPMCCNFQLYKCDYYQKYRVKQKVSKMSLNCNKGT